ncbi:MAG: polysaccharide deacetylase [Spirochaetes bacterium]|nr:polysaccharide deacetylase [Spirochaetota bacterium]
MLPRVYRVALHTAAALLSAATALQADIRHVAEYESVMIPCSTRAYQERLMALRRFTVDGREMFLVVERDTLRTRVEPRDALTIDGGPRHASFGPDGSAWASAVLSSASPPYRIHNGGIRNFSRDLEGAVLSVDLCPSTHPLQRQIFTMTANAFKSRGTPVPVSLCVSGLWLENHENDLKWLRDLEAKGKIVITWVNHSYTHPREFRPSPRTLRKGFLLSKGVDFGKEVLLAETRMLERGLVPSVFFRFPGLVSDGRLMEKLKEFGLIALGSDAWLAKREPLRNGSVILVHGNGHEKAGIGKYYAQLERRKRKIARGEWKLLDVRDCTAAAFRRHHDWRYVPRTARLVGLTGTWW